MSWPGVLKQEITLKLDSISTMQQSPTLTLLSFKYAAVIDLAIAARECGRAHQTFLNELSGNRCRLKCFKQGRRWYVRLVDLAEYIDSHFQSVPEQDHSRPVAAKRGRPTKAEMVARRTALLHQHSAQSTVA